HAVIMNATKREDGQWRSLTNEEIYNAQRVIGAIYTSELADRLQALGYDIRRTDEKGNFEIAGITREQIEHFSQRRAEIEAA
ncbi:relaxase domain-containing protein, partial [Mycobacterium tuberculosis]|nr:relaxase domain-containing protein [Mycobacterium tuberculosis]